MLQFREEFICTFSLTALHIDAEVVRWVYTVGSEKPSAAYKADALKTVTHQASGFFSSLFAGFGASSTPRRTPTPVPVTPKESINLLEANSSNVVLTIFAANVDVRLDTNMTRVSRQREKRHTLQGVYSKGFGLIWKGLSHHSE